MTIVVFVQVVMRYVLKLLSWSELTRFLIFMVLLGWRQHAVRERSHFEVECSWLFKGASRIWIEYLVADLVCLGT